MAMGLVMNSDPGTSTFPSRRKLSDLESPTPGLSSFNR